MATGPLDPFEDNSQQIWVLSNIYESLFWYNQTTNALIPWLATNYTVNSNATVWTFNLRQGVTFSDGTPFNATAVKDSTDWQIIGGSEGGQTMATFIKNGQAFLNSNQDQANVTYFEAHDGITIVSPYVVQFDLTGPCAVFPSYLSQVYASFMISPSAVIAHGGIKPGSGNSYFDGASAGTGPYSLTSYSAASGDMVLTANTHYWAASVFGINPPFKQVFVNVVTNDATEELDVRTGQANVILLPNAEFYDFADRGQWANGKLVSDVPGTSIWGPYPTPVVYTMFLNQVIHLQNGTLAKVQPFANADMREAFNYAWNETGFISSSLNGLGVPYVGLVFQGQLGYQTPTFPYPYNLTIAKQEIQKACAALGCSPTNPLTITIEGKNLPVINAAAVILAVNINSLNAGVDVSYSAATAATSYSVYLAQTEGMQMGGLGGPYDPGVCSLFCIADGSQQGAYQIGYNDSSVNALLSQALTNGNATQRAALYEQANALVAKDGNYIPIAEVSTVIVTSSNVKVVDYASYISGTLPTIVELAPSS